MRGHKALRLEICICIDEDAAFELSGVYYLQKTSFDLEYTREKLERAKGKGLFY